ncbi:hypothetical protein [Burkholderia vietnamiensis]|uniref:hypothetical protein n=1 Tax=Burkholderia vietnamiensis TaxID=60552 RepID=UPI001FC874E3|nr:hypothetical protein [Burkholderia vietnamiensis]
MAGAQPIWAPTPHNQKESYTLSIRTAICLQFDKADFSDQVETFAIPSWAKRDGAPWLPNLAALGYCHADSGYRGRDEQFVATAAVDMHTDDEGLVLMVVLHNDGLTFRQGTVRHKPKAGDWFIFDDRLPHGVVEAPGRAAFLGWNIPIIPL